MQNANDSQHQQWQLKAQSEVLGDLTLTIDDNISVGRGNDNDVVLGSKQISRNHALLNILNDELYIKDLGSSNGTFVNDIQLPANKSTHLQNRDVISFAGLIFQVVSNQAQQTEQTKQTDHPKASETELSKEDSLTPVLPIQDPDDPTHHSAQTSQNSPATATKINEADEVSDIKATTPSSSEPVSEQANEQTVVQNDNLTQTTIKNNEVTPSENIEENVEKVVAESTEQSPELSPANQNAQDTQLASPEAAPINPIVPDEAESDPTTNDTLPPHVVARKEESNKGNINEVNKDNLNTENTDSVAAPLPSSLPTTPTEASEKDTKPADSEQSQQQTVTSPSETQTKISTAPDTNPSETIGKNTDNPVRHVDLNNQPQAQTTSNKQWIMWVIIILAMIAIALWLFNGDSI